MKHFLPQHLPRQTFRRYAKFGAKIFRRCVALARTMDGLEIIHINSTAAGGGVAELLKDQVPLEADLGLRSRWLVLQESKRFFFITKKIHNLLQGGHGSLSEPEKQFYLSRLKTPGKELKKFLDKAAEPIVMVLHDPQVLPLIAYLPASVRTIVRLHIDLSAANKSILDFLKPFLEKADKVVISHALYRPSWLDKKKTAISYPAINPFSEKNRPLNLRRGQVLLQRFGIEPSRPLITQVSRFDTWKDPDGVIEAYCSAKNRIPELQLVLEGVMEAKDDPEAADIYHRLKAEHGIDPDIFLHGGKVLPEPAYQTWVNALQSLAGVVIQKSLKEGFGLTVTEALWKGKAVIGGNATGIKAQIKNGHNGFIVKSPAECAKRIVQLFKNPSLAQRLGRRGQETVRKKFLFNHLILDFLMLYRELIKKTKTP